MGSKIRVNISVTQDTAERLKQYAYENHTNVSQAITDWIWAAKVSGGQVRGQESIGGLQAGEKPKKRQGKERKK